VHIINKRLPAAGCPRHVGLSSALLRAGSALTKALVARSRNGRHVAPSVHRISPPIPATIAADASGNEDKRRNGRGGILAEDSAREVRVARVSDAPLY